MIEIEDIFLSIYFLIKEFFNLLLMEKIIYLKVIYFLGSFLIGFLGSFSYLLLVKLGFAGGKTPEERDVILRPFFEHPFRYVFLYCFMGGFISGIFQLVTINAFVPIQSLVMGLTWPSFVAGYLSGRQAEITPEERKSDSMLGASPIKATYQILDNTLESTKDILENINKDDNLFNVGGDMHE